LICRLSRIGVVLLMCSGCVALMNVEHSRGSGPGVNSPRAQAELSPPGRAGFYVFESQIQIESTRIRVAPENQRTRFVLFGLVVPVVPLWRGFFGAPEPQRRFWVAIRIDGDDSPRTLDPGQIKLRLDGGETIVPEGFYSNGCEGRDFYRGGTRRHLYGAPLESLAGRIALPSPSCLNLAFPVSPPPPSGDGTFALELDGLMVRDVPLDVPTISFTPEDGWLVFVEGAS